MSAYHHTIFYVSPVDANHSKHRASHIMISLVRQYLLTSQCTNIPLSLAYYNGYPTIDARTRIKRVVKHEQLLASSLESLDAFEREESGVVAPSGGASFVLSQLLRGLLNEVGGGVSTQGKVVKLSVAFSQVPDVRSDVDLASCLNGAKIANATVEFIYFANILDTAASEQLAELVLLIANFAHVSLSRIALHSSELEDVARLRSAWITWSNPEAANKRALLSLSAQQAPISMETVPLINVENPAAGGVPQKLLSCKCHGLVVSSPPRCQVTGRKPALVPVHGYTLGCQGEGGGSGILAVDRGVEAPLTFAAFATIPSTAFDCSVVMGNPEMLVSSDVRLRVLSEQLRAQDCCLVLRKTDRFGATLHIAAPGVGARNLVMVRVATQDDVLVVPQPEHNGIDDVADPSTVKLVAEALQSLPHPAQYNPLAYSTNWSQQVGKAIVADARTISEATIVSASSKGGLIKGVLNMNE